MDRRIAIGVGILILVSLGFLVMTTMTGGVITGPVVAPLDIKSEYYRISDFGNSEVGLNEKEVDDGEGGSR